ncbi:MAG: YggS family pyridoxal phosphate-dependent enzyme [Persicimonas sp.]
MADSTTSQYDPDELRQNLAEIRERISDACERAGRLEDAVTLIAVSKTHPVDAMRVLYKEGQRHFGESYVQEWQEKAPEMADDVVWHFIGHLQSNKARFIADDMAFIHSVDRKSVMKKLHKRSEERVDVLLQVNIADQESKSGVDPDGLIDLVELSRNYPSLRARGLMTIPPYVDDPEDNRPHFRRMRELFNDARNWLAEHGPEDLEAFEHLSMGMSGDFEVAIEEGATMVRVGTSLFGARHYD